MLIPFENDYLFKKWGINSILLDNPLTFEYDSVIPSDLESNNIIMIGRANDIYKRFDLGIHAMTGIIKEIPKCEMNIIFFSVKKLEDMIKELNLTKSVRFLGYHEKIEISSSDTAGTKKVISNYEAEKILYNQLNLFKKIIIA